MAIHYTYIMLPTRESINGAVSTPKCNSSPTIIERVEVIKEVASSRPRNMRRLVNITMDVPLPVSHADAHQLLMTVIMRDQYIKFSATQHNMDIETLVNRFTEQFYGGVGILFNMHYAAYHYKVRLIEPLPKLYNRRVVTFEAEDTPTQCRYEYIDPKNYMGSYDRLFLRWPRDNDYDCLAENHATGRTSRCLCIIQIC